MTPREQTEMAYELGEIDATEFRNQLRALNLSEQYIEDVLSDINRFHASENADFQ